MVLAPGFADILSHSRFALLAGDGRLVSKVTQGITLEIMGEGSTNAPVNERALAAETDEQTRQMNRAFLGPRGFLRWMKAIEKRGSSVNFGSFAGASTLRMIGKGLAEGAPTPEEMEEMRRAVREAMEDGAFGIASA
ncbi:MAG: dihydroorotase, partial [Chloracidobacterium sp. CP2_5A]